MSDYKKDPTPQRWFGLRAEAHPTEIQVAEYSDGSIGIILQTTRDGMEPLVTNMRLRSVTFALLAEAMARAAHDPEVWREFKNEEESK